MMMSEADKSADDMQKRTYYYA